MAILLDTHIFLHFINGEKSIPKKTINLILNPASVIHLSIASIWEITIKISIGKLQVRDNLQSIYRIIKDYDIKLLFPTKEHFLINLTLPLIHKDPFDRLIIAQAIADDLLLITDDEQIKTYPNLKLF